MPELLLATAALAAGYILGRLRIGTRTFDWADETISRPEVTRRTVRWWLCEAVFAVAVARLFIVEPRRTAHEWRHRNDPPPPLDTVPVFDPDWAAKRGGKEADHA